MLRIVFKDGSERIYKKKQFNDYMYDRKFFIVINKKGTWVGMYNLDCIATIEYLKKH